MLVTVRSVYRSLLFVHLDASVLTLWRHFSIYCAVKQSFACFMVSIGHAQIFPNNWTRLASCFDGGVGEISTSCVVFTVPRLILLIGIMSRFDTKMSVSVTFGDIYKS